MTTRESFGGAVAQLGERIPRTDEASGSTPLCSTNVLSGEIGADGDVSSALQKRRLHIKLERGEKTAVLGGEVAVPCNPQSAVAGPNSQPEVIEVRDAPGDAQRRGSGPAQRSPAELRQTREGAAVGGVVRVPRVHLAGAGGCSGGGRRRIEGGCTAVGHFP